MTNQTNPPACRVMYQSYSGLIFPSRQPADTPALVIPLDPANVERVVEVMREAMIAADGNETNLSFEDDARSAISALINHAKENAAMKGTK